MFLIGRSFVRKDPRMIAAIMLGAILFSCVQRFVKKSSINFISLALMNYEMVNLTFDKAFL
jgi:hypothetical protein